jgi:hypothetical protein
MAVVQAATIAVAFMVSVAAFAAWTGYLLMDAHRRRVLPFAADVRPTREERDAARAEMPPNIGRVRLAVVLLSFLVWSLVLTNHVHSRR